MLSFRSQSISTLFYFLALRTELARLPSSVVVRVEMMFWHGPDKIGSCPPVLDENTNVMALGNLGSEEEYRRSVV